MVKLFLIRHGETSWNKDQRCQGSTDIELTPKGREQLGALAHSLRREEIEGVYAGPLRRALETATAIANFHRLEVKIEEGLKYLKKGLLGGLTPAQLVSSHRDFLKKWMDEPAFLKMPQGECMAELQQRIRKAIQRIVQNHPEGSVVAVSHKLTIRTILCQVINLPLREFRRLKQDVAAKKFGRVWAERVGLVHPERSLSFDAFGGMR